MASPSQADSLIGSSIQAEYRYPDSDTVYPGSTISTNPFLVGAGEETIISIEEVTDLHINFDSASLLITLNTILPAPIWGSADQNGPAFTVLSGNPFPAISSVSSTGIIGPVSAFLSSGVLFVNWAGLAYRDGDTVTVNFAPVSAVPLPAALPLFVGGLAAMAWLGRRKRRATKG